MPDSTLLLIELGEGRLPNPPGSFQFLVPRVTVDGRRRVHLVWGEPTQVPTRGIEALDNPHVTELWHAVYDSTWSKPERILVAETVHWQAGTADIAISGDVVHVVAVASGSDYGPARRMLLATWSSGAGWRVQPILHDWAPVYLSLAVLPSTIGIALAHTDPADQSARNRLYWTESLDGRSWSWPKPVEPTSSGPAYGVWALADSVRTHVVWLVDNGVERGSEAIRHAWRSGNGAWNPVSDLVVRGAINRLDSTLDTCGELHVMAEVLPLSPYARLRYWSWSPAVGWRDPADPFRDTDVSGPVALVRPGITASSNPRVTVVYSRLALDETGSWQTSLQAAVMR